MAVAEAKINQALYADVCSTVQSKYFEQLCNLPDLESLLPHFEEQNIITVHQHVEIKSSNSPTDDRMKMLLDNISLPLQNGSTERFDGMLEILMDHGTDETKMIASLIKSEVKGFVKFKSHMQTIQDFMPVDFMGTTDILHDCFTDSQVSDVFNCESSIAANQLILKYLTANLSDVKDLLEFCTQLEKISKSLKMNTIISDIRSAVEHPRHEYPRHEYPRHEHPRHDHRPEENFQSLVSTVFKSQEVDNEQQCTGVEVFQPVSDIVSNNGTEADPEIDHNEHELEGKETDSVSTGSFITQSLSPGFPNEQNKDKPPFKPQRSDPHPLPLKQRICCKYQSPPPVPEYHIRRHYLFNKIAQAICSSSDTFVPGEECVMVTIAGAGGFGKTTLALDICHHHDVKDVFTNGIIFIELDPQTCDPGKILNDHYCQMTGKDFQYINNIEEKIQELTKIFKNVLVIIDDVWRVEDARPIVKAFSYCKIILTTRNPDIGIPSKQTIDIGPMSLRESVSLMTYGVLENSELSKEDVIVINELAQSTHQWPLLLSLIRGQLYHSIKQSHTTLKNAILDVQRNLTIKGLVAFDIKTTRKIRQLSVRACIEVSLGLLDKSDESLKLKDKLLSLILYTGIGGSLPSRAVKCLWKVSGETTKKATSLLQQYGLVYSKCSKQMPPYYNTAYMFVTVHSVISEYIMGTIKSETVGRLSPFIFLKTDQLIATVEELLFQQSHEVNPFSKPEFLIQNKLKMEHIVLPYYMKEINMHVLHDPHLAQLILHNIQSLLNDARYYHLLALLNEEIVSLITECHNALKNAQGLSRKVNEHFQLCFRIMSFDNLIPLLKEYLETHFIVTTITRCVELAETICTQCDAELKAAMTTKCKELQILTKEYHAISAEKLPRFKLHIELHNKITRALLQNKEDEIEKLYLDITTGKFEEEVQLVHDNYLIKMQDVHTGDSGEKALVTKQQNNYMQSLNNEVQQQRQSMTDLAITDQPYLPPDIVNWIGDIETESFDDGGGIFYSFNHDTTVTIPPDAIPKGKQGMLKFAATLCAPVKFAPNVVPVSAIVWLCMDVELQKPITLCLPHCVSVENVSHVNSLCFAKMTHASPSEGYMSVIDSGEFKVGEAFGLVDIDQSCYYCIVNSATVAKDIPENKYRIVAMKHKIPKIDHWNCDVCLIPSLSTCRTHLEEQYKHKREEFTCDREESGFTFASYSTKLKLDINQVQFNNDAEVEITSDYEISKENVDFQQCYRNHLLLKEFKEKLEFESYPPRFKIGIKVKNRSFFGTQQCLEFLLMGGKSEFQKNITIAAAFNDIP
ncbi:uncharacterized protein [Dysidea avara]|uniref:uncharacterized protein isoform X2 n=1 Tax=Dysidea avara TaxID=196820 RepID=UPI00332CAD02